MADPTLSQKRAALVGSVGPEYAMPIEQGKIREFATATLSDNFAYKGEAAPVPATFLTTNMFWEPNDPGFDVELDWMRVLHGEQEYVFHGPPPPAGTKLTGQAKLASVIEKEGRRGGTMTMFLTVTEFRDEQGRLVAEARSTAIETGRATVEEGQ